MANLGKRSKIVVPNGLLPYYHLPPSLTGQLKTATEPMSAMSAKTKNQNTTIFLICQPYYSPSLEVVKVRLQIVGLPDIFFLRGGRGGEERGKRY